MSFSIDSRAMLTEQYDGNSHGLYPFTMAKLLQLLYIALERSQTVGLRVGFA